MNEPLVQPLFATRRPLMISGVREVLLAAGIPTYPQIIDPNEIARTVSGAGDWLALLDGDCLPPPETLEKLCGAHPGSYFVVWTVHPTADLLQAAVECGLHGVLSTRLPLEEAAQTLQRICRGERLFRFDTNPGPLELPRPLRLSSREQQVLFLLADGVTNAAIAARLGTTESTIKVCLSRMFRKTGARNRHELLLLGRSGILPAEEPRCQEPPKLVAIAGGFDAQWMLHEGDPRRGQE